MSTSVKMPAIFFGHGNPLNALAQNEYTVVWARIGAALPRPRAILVISAHWYLPGTAVTAMAQPRTIHDFGGFPRELYQVQYPAPGDPELGSRVQDLLHSVSVRLDLEWGLDHGTWSVLCHLFPDADIPVVQLSLDETRPAAFHYELGRQLAPLRDEGVLVMGSGNLVHNLHAYAWGGHPLEPLDWAVRFEAQARAFMITGQDEALVAYESLGRDALLAAPTPEHFLPLLYILGVRAEDDEITFPVQGFDGGSISMLSVQLG